jgi:uncharacterized membrane protein YphA (DoxX/SURF4 family)
MKRLTSLNGLLGVVFLLTSIFLIYKGYTSETIVDEFNIYWMFTWSLLGLGAIIVAHEKGIVIATVIARVFTGSLFVVSGLIKANDPKGFAYKLEDYFQDNSLGDFWANFYDYALPLAILIATAEVVLGLAVLFGGKARLATWTLFIMALFFAWLTWFTATCLENRTTFSAEKQVKIEKIKTDCGDYYNYINEDLSEGYLPEEIAAINDCKNKYLAVDTVNFETQCVDDCGCFGDAMKGSVGRSLTPWESFYKDMLLIVFVIVLLFRQKSITFNTSMDDMIIFALALPTIGMFSGLIFSWWFPLWFTVGAIIIYKLLKKYHIRKIGVEWTVALVMTLYALAFTLYCWYYLPVKDFRPYAIGKDLIEERTHISPKIKYFYILKNKATGEEKEFEAFPENYEVEWDYVTLREEVQLEGRIAPAGDFSLSLMETGEDITDSVLSMDRVILAISSDLEKGKQDAFAKLNELYQEALKEGIPFFLTTGTSGSTANKLKSEWKAEYPFCNSDEKVLKTIVRSNPGIIVLKKKPITDTNELQRRKELRESGRAKLPEYRMEVVGIWPSTDLPGIEEIKTVLQ